MITSNIYMDVFPCVVLETMLKVVDFNNTKLFFSMQALTYNPVYSNVILNSCK